MAASIVVGSSLTLTTSGLTSFFVVISGSIFCLLAGALVPAFVTLFDAPWKARVDCCDLVAGPEDRRLGGIVNILDRYLRFDASQSFDTGARQEQMYEVVVRVSVIGLARIDRAFPGCQGRCRRDGATR
jgi:hypothetical protein